MTAPDELLTVGEVAAMFTLDPDTLYGWRGREYGPASFKLGKRVVYRRSDVESWVAAQQAATTKGGQS